MPDRDDELLKYADLLWSQTMNAIERGLPVAHYEVVRCRERLLPVMEQIEPQRVQ